MPKLDIRQFSEKQDELPTERHAAAVDSIDTDRNPPTQSTISERYWTEDFK